MMFLALKHLITRKKQTLVTLLGIIIGTTAFIVISGFFEGFQSYLIDNLISGDAHIKVQARERQISREEVEKILYPEYSHFHWTRIPAGRRAAAYIENPPGWYDRFDSNPHFVAATSSYSTNALINYNQTAYSVVVNGIKPSSQIKVTNIESKMIEGSILDLEKGTGRIVIGSELAMTLAKQVGDSVVLTTHEGKLFPFKVVGIFSVGNKRMDLTNTYTKITDAQILGNAVGKISEISIRLDDFRQAAEIASNWKKTSFDKVESWDQANESLINIFTTQDMLSFMTSGVITLVAAFGIYNVLNMVVNQKRKDIAILRSMGYEARDVISLFLIQGLILGLLGGALGCLLGKLIAVSIGSIELRPPGGGGHGGVGAGAFTLEVKLSFYLFGLMISNFAALAASYFPARSASKLTPIDIIRGAE